MTWEAHRRLLAFDLAAAVERCGGLLGDRVGDVITIRDVSLSERAEHATATSAKFDLEHLEATSARHAEQTGLAMVGDWHSHPSLREAAGKPSETDLRSWVTSLDWHDYSRETGCHVGLIVTPTWQPAIGHADDLAAMRAVRWLEPRMHAFAVRLDQAGQPVADVLEVELEPTPMRPWVPPLGAPMAVA